MNLRPLLGTLVAAIAAWSLFAVFRSPPEPASAPLAFTSSAQCRACHAETWDEWAESWHARSWSDPEVRALSNDFQNTDCIDCHAPRPVFETGIGERVLPRSSRRSEGVDCLSCHLLPGDDSAALAGARVAGTRDDAAAACRPAAVRALGSPEFCGACHDQHQTVAQWRASRFAAEGIGCVDCHMPHRDGDPARGRDHTMHGGHDLELVRSAIELRGRREGERCVVEVENVGAGHHFPTDERSRAADVFWRTIAADGSRGSWRHLHRFRSPYRHEADLVDTLLPAGATEVLAIEGPDVEGAAIEVALFYKLTPYWSDPARPDPEAEARLVHRIEIAR